MKSAVFDALITTASADLNVTGAMILGLLLSHRPCERRATVRFDALGRHLEAELTFQEPVQQPAA